MTNKIPCLWPERGVAAVDWAAACRQLSSRDRAFRGHDQAALAPGDVLTPGPIPAPAPPPGTGPGLTP